VKIVLDTNVLVSAFLNPQGVPAKTLRLVLQGDLSIVISEHILTEYGEVLARPKFGLSESEVPKILAFFRSRGVRAPSLTASFELPDFNDVPFLEAALATRADALITGNKRHFPKRACRGQPVLTPKEFLDHLADG